ncbi:MAG: DJ-1/PfpI family protein [Pseudomonas sp.]
MSIANTLPGMKILILVSNGVDEGSMSNIQRELLKTGAVINTVGIESGLVNSWNNNAWGLYFPVDQTMGVTLGSDFDAVVVPSGSRGIQKLSGSAHSERFLSSFVESGKPMAFVGDAVELLAKIGLATGWNVAGPEGVKETMTTAGATWAGTGPTVHNILLTGDAPDQVAFVAEIVAHFQGKTELKAAA